MNTKHITKEHSVCAIMHGISREIACFPTKSVECFVPLFSNILGEDFSRVYLLYACNAPNLPSFKTFVCLLNLNKIFENACEKLSCFSELRN